MSMYVLIKKIHLSSSLFLSTQGEKVYEDYEYAKINSRLRCEKQRIMTIIEKK